MKLTHCFLFAVTALVYISCQKSLSFEKEEEEKPTAVPNDFKHNVMTYRYRLVAFYSDKPINFIPGDSVKRSETDLWNYVPGYLKDDDYLFTSDSTFTIYQNQWKIPTNNADSIKARYSIDTVAGKTIFTFVDYHYEPFKYELDSFNKDYFLVHVAGPDGSRLYSKFARRP